MTHKKSHSTAKHHVQNNHLSKRFGLGVLLGLNVLFMGMIGCSNSSNNSSNNSANSNVNNSSNANNSTANQAAQTAAEQTQSKQPLAKQQLAKQLANKQPLNQSGTEAQQKAYAANVLNQQILYSLTDAATKAQALQSSVNKLCQTKKPKQADVQVAKTAWQQAVLAWSGAAVSNIKSINQPDMRNRLYIYAYPDYQKLTPRNITRILADTNELDLAWAEAENIRPIGLVGMEYLIFEQAKQAKNIHKNPRYCQLLNTQAAMLAKDIQAFLTLWQGDYGQSFASLTGDFSQRNAALTAWFNSLLKLAEYMHTQKLAYPAGLSASGQPKSHYESQYAHISSPLFAASVAALKKGISGDDNSNNSDKISDHTNGNATGLAAYITQVSETVADEQLKQQQITLAKTLRKQMAAVAQTMQSITAADLANATPAQRKQLHKTLSELISTLSMDVPQALNIHITFNEADGD